MKTIATSKSAFTAVQDFGRRGALAYRVENNAFQGHNFNHYWWIVHKVDNLSKILLNKLFYGDKFTKMKCVYIFIYFDK